MNKPVITAGAIIGFGLVLMWGHVSDRERETWSVTCNGIQYNAVGKVWLARGVATFWTEDGIKHSIHGTCSMKRKD